MPLETIASSGSNDQNAAIYGRLLSPPQNAGTEIDEEEGERRTRPRPKHRPIGSPSPGPRPTGPCWKGEYAKSIVYGGMDAIVTCFSLISSISAGRLSSVDVLVLGFANLVADGISMGFGDFVSSTTERHVAVKEREIAEWELDHQHGGGSGESYLIQRYQKLGMDVDDALTVVNILSKYKNILVQEKMAAQRGTLQPDEAEKPWKNGLVTFAAFLAFGCAPLLSFIVLIPFTRSDTVKFVGACVLSALALALLGLARAKIAGENYVLSVLITLSNGAVAAAVAYAVGCALRNIAGLDADNP